MRRAKGARELIFDGIDAITDLVHKSHVEVAERWTKRAKRVPGVEPVAESVHAVHMAGATVNYATVKFISRGVGAVLGMVTDPLLKDGNEAVTPLREDEAGSTSWVLDHLECSLNGFIGDHLARQGNCLDLGMHLRHKGRAISPESLNAEFPNKTAKVCVFIHGLSATEWSWVFYAESLWGDSTSCYAKKLEEDLDYTCLFVRYNTGRHVSENGQALSELLEKISTHYSIPIEQIVLVGHSMGGLVARSAAHEGQRSNAIWVEQLKHVVCLGSPHLGAPLEKGAHLLSAVLKHIPAAGATVPASIINCRSEGIKDLRHGYITEDEWRDADVDALFDDKRQDLPLVRGVNYTAFAATVSKQPEHPIGQLVGDFLVRKFSAFGGAPETKHDMHFQNREIFAGLNHLHLANHPEVYEKLLVLLDEE